MVWYSSDTLINKIADKLEEYKAKNIVVDPVMVATSGAKLICDEAVDALKKRLLPIATVLTPNIPEAEVLSGMEIHTEEDMHQGSREDWNRISLCSTLQRRTSAKRCQ